MNKRIFFLFLSDSWNFVVTLENKFLCLKCKACSLIGQDIDKEVTRCREISAIRLQAPKVFFSKRRDDASSPRFRIAQNFQELEKTKIKDLPLTPACAAMIVKRGQARLEHGAIHAIL